MNISSACCVDCPTADHQQTANFSSGRRRPSASPSSIFIHHHPSHPLRHHHGSASSCLSPGLPFYGDGIGSVGDPYYQQHQQRPRQNSVVVFATAHFMTAARRVKSAMDLQTLVLREETEESVHALSCTGTGGETPGLLGSSATDNHHGGGTITCVWISILFFIFAFSVRFIQIIHHIFGLPIFLQLLAIFIDVCNRSIHGGRRDSIAKKEFRFSRVSIFFGRIPNWVSFQIYVFIV